MRRIPPLRRFALYGLLRNQRYFEPFLVLAFLDKGLGFFEIGLLIAFREFVVNLLEIPSGALADMLGRRRVLIAAHVAYVASFVLFGAAHALPLLFVAMFLFAIGESFRTGTHKAMIFDWLRHEDRTAEKTKVYGYTRSWSKTGSAVSVLIAALIVLVTRCYEYTFYLCAIPYALGVVNLLGYPDYLEGEGRGRVSWRGLVDHLRATWRVVVEEQPLRRLVAQSMGFDGVFYTVKDYLQPVLKAAVVPLAAGIAFAADLSEPQKVAIVAAPVYFGLHALSAVASRRAHRVVERAGDEFRAVRWLWTAGLAVAAALTLGGAFDWFAVLVLAFIALHVLHNFWRPIQVGRYDRFGRSLQGATVLSLESQSRRVATMLAAPLLGLAVDATVASGAGGAFWPVGVLGLVVGLALFPRR
ncbi:MAG: MFS transporter [Planctomycetota bacterium]